MSRPGLVRAIMSLGHKQAPTSTGALRLVREEHVLPPGHIHVVPEFVGLNIFDAMRLDGYARRLLNALTGRAWDDNSPHRPGREGVGINLETGQRVAFSLPVASVGALASQLALPPSAIVPVPDGMASEVAAALPYPGLTAMAAVDEVLRVTDNDNVFVAGVSGPVGVLAAQLASVRGAANVVGVCSSTSRDRIAHLLPNIEILAYDNPDESDTIHKAIDNSHAVLNAAGLADADVLCYMNSASDMTRSHGLRPAYATLNGPLPHLTDEGGLAVGSALASADLIAAKSKALDAGYTYDWVLYHPSPPGLEELIHRVHAGEISPLLAQPDTTFAFGPFPSGHDIDLDAPILDDERQALDAVAQAFQTLRNGAPAKVLVKVDQ